MASVCGATLGLMSAGVPIQNPVAGISVGLVRESEDQWTLLTDILGDEDHFGDMDFKVAGTQNGITGIQLDLKITGISEDIIRAALVQAKDARMEILRAMLKTISRPSEDISEYAPRLIKTKIEADKIGLLIGPGGKTIRQIQETTGTIIEIEEDGTVLISGTDRDWAKKALDHVEALTATVQVGKIYQGTVNSIREFGAFLEILPGRDGLCHVSEISSGYIDNVADLIRVGDEFAVQVIEVDDHGRIKLSRRRALEELGEEDPLAEKIQKMSEGRGERGEGRDERGEGRGERGDRGRRGDGGDRSGGRRRQSRGGGGGGGRRS